jgi:hypothetical protein
MDGKLIRVDGPHHEEEDDVPDLISEQMANDSGDVEEEEEQPAQPAAEPEQPLADDENKIQPEDPIEPPPALRRTTRIPKPCVLYKPKFTGQ